MRQAETILSKGIVYRKGTVLEGKLGTKTVYRVIENIYLSERTGTVYFTFHNGSISTLEQVNSNYRVMEG